MSKNLAAETLRGNYHVVTTPDGQLVMLTKLSDGSWVLTEDRIKEDDSKKGTTQIEFEKRFDGTKTVPNDFVKQDTEILTPDLDKMKKNFEGSRNRLDAYLGEILGDPDDILSGKIKVNPIQIVRHKEHVIGLITVLNNPKWNRVKELIWK